MFASPLVTTASAAGDRAASQRLTRIAPYCGPAHDHQIVNRLDIAVIVNYVDDMHAKPRLLETLTWELRRAFRDLAAAGDRELEPLGIGTQDRALLEFLARESAPISLSELARKRSVSRQHIHQSLRRLSDPEWVDELPDPADRRTVLLSLSRKGRAFWRRIQARDAAAFARLASHFQPEELQAAIQTVVRLRTAIRETGKP